MVLEIEPPNSETQSKRISFYEKSGFKLDKRDYMQPPYSPDKNHVKMFLMSYPIILTVEKFEETKKQFYKKFTA